MQRRLCCFLGGTNGLHRIFRKESINGLCTRNFWFGCSTNYAIGNYSGPLTTFRWNQLSSQPLHSCFSTNTDVSTMKKKSTNEELHSLMNYQYSRNTWQLIQDQLQRTDQNTTIVVLDDDPTGCQTLYDINVLIDFSKESLKKQLLLNHKLFYVLINSRSMPEKEAKEVNQQVLSNLMIAAKELSYSKSFVFVSRSDSTLRGHFPLETNTIQQFLQNSSSSLKQFPPANGIILCPTFFEGGRYTMNNIHYFLNERKELIPVGETDFAKDPHFPYQSSNLIDWIVEKSKGEILSKDIITISLDELRKKGGEDSVKEKLLAHEGFAYVVVNAGNENDLNIFNLGLLKAEAEGNRRYIGRSAASFVASRAGIPPKPLLSFSSSSSSLNNQDRERGGLIVVGSYVSKSSKQLSQFLSRMDVESLEINVAQILSLFQQQKKRFTNELSSLSSSSSSSSTPFDGNQLQEIIFHTILHQHPHLFELFTSYLYQISKTIFPAITPISSSSSSSLPSTTTAAVGKAKDLILYTSRTFVTNSDLIDLKFISYFITQLIYYLQEQPAFIISKGGITSHEVAQYGLSVSSAKVLGQIEKGIPVWQLSSFRTDDHDGEEGGGDGMFLPFYSKKLLGKKNAVEKFTDLMYVVFPGNVGDEEALCRVANKLGVPYKKEKEEAPASSSSSIAVEKSSVGQREEKSSLWSVLGRMKEQKQAMAAFNIYNMEGAKAVVEAAEELQQPIILQVHPSSLSYGGEPFLAYLSTLKSLASIPIFIHFDHFSERKDLETIFNLISKRQQPSSSTTAWGVDSVMVDGSPLPFEENLLFTKEMTKIAHSLGLFVEAELGKLAGEEDGLRVDLKEMKMTDPLTLPRFLQETNVDLLAVTIGNVHGKYASSNPLLDFDRFHEINQQLHRVASNSHHHHHHQKIPFLVLHGASGLPMSTIQRCKAMGIVKFNVNTDLRTAAMDYYSQTFQRQQLEKKNVDVLPLMKGSTKVMKAVAMEKIRLFSM